MCLVEMGNQEIPRNAWEIYKEVMNRIDGGENAWNTYYTTIHKNVYSSSIVYSVAQLLRLSLRRQGKEILDWIHEKQVFSRVVLQDRFNLMDGEASSILRSLKNCNLVSLVGNLDTTGKKSPVYLIDGGDRSLIPDAVREHHFLKNSAAPISLEDAQIEATCAEIVDEALTRVQVATYLGDVKHKKIQRGLIMELFRNRGLSIMPFGRITRILESRGWGLEG